MIVCARVPRIPHRQKMVKYSLSAIQRYTYFTRSNKASTASRLLDLAGSCVPGN